MPLQDIDPFGEAFLELFGAWRETGSPYHGVPPELNRTMAPRPSLSFPTVAPIVADE